MDLSKDVIETLQYLLPGFLAAWVLYGLTSFPKPSQFERIVQALIFTLIIQAATLGLRSLLLRIGNRWSIGEWNANVEISWNIALALIIGATFSYFSNNDKIHSMLRRIRLTKVTSYPSEWTGVFTERETFIVVQLHDERRLYGWPKVWPSDPRKGHILLEVPYWLDDAGEPQKLEGVDSILLNVEDIRWVEFFENMEEMNNGHEVP